MHNVTATTKLKLRGRDFHLVEYTPTKDANSNAVLQGASLTPTEVMEATVTNKIWLPFLPDDNQDTLQKWLALNNVSTQGLAVLDLWPLIDWWREQDFSTLQLSNLGTIFASLFMRDSEYIVLPLNQARYGTYNAVLKDAVLRAPLPSANLHLTDSVVHATKPLEHSGTAFIRSLYLSLEEKPDLRDWSTTWGWRHLKPQVATATRRDLFEADLNLAPNELNLIYQRRRAALYSGENSGPGSPNAISRLAATNPKDPLHSFLAITPFHKTAESSMMLPDAYPLMATMVENENGQEGAKNTEPKIRYWQDETSFRYGRYTVSRLGAYLTKYWQHAFSAARIQELVEGITHGAAEKAEQILFARTRGEVEEVYLRGPHSCMVMETANFEARPVYESGIHPTAVYASPDFAVAYLKDTLSSRVVARALTRESTKTFVRVYDVNDSAGQGPHGKALRSALIFKGYRQERPAELPKGSDGPLADDAFHVFVPAFRDTGTVIAPYLDVGDGSGLGAGGLMVYAPEALAAGDIIPESVMSSALTMDDKDPLPAGWRWWPALYAGRSSPIDKVASLQSDGYLAYLVASSLKGAYYLRDGSYSDNASGLSRTNISYGDGYRNDDDDDDDEDSEETDTQCVISEDWFYSYGTEYSTITVITGRAGHYYASQDEAMDSNIEYQTGNDVDDGEFTTNNHTFTPNENVVPVHTGTTELDLVEPMARMVSTFCPLFELYIGTAGARTARDNTHRPSLLLLPPSSFDAAGNMVQKAMDELLVSNAENLNKAEIFTKIVVKAAYEDLFGEYPEEIWYGALAPHIEHFNERDVATKVLSRLDEPNTHQSVIWLTDAEKTPSDSVMEAALASMLRPQHPYFAGYTEPLVASGLLTGVRLRHMEHSATMATMATVPWYTSEEPILVSRG
jgi:hypothetical protein